MFSQLENEMWRDANPWGTQMKTLKHTHTHSVYIYIYILTTNAIIAQRRVWFPFIKCSGLSHTTIGGSGRLALKTKQYSPTRICASS